MESIPKKRLASVRTHFLSPFRHIFKPKTDDITKKPLTMNLLSSYLRYKKHPLSGNFKQNIKSFLKSLHGKEKNSSLLITSKNFMDQKKLKTRNYKLIKRHFNKHNNNQNTTKNVNIFPRSLSEEEEKYRKRYKYVMENLSFNGNNSFASFKNISNNMLDDIFKHRPFISYDGTKIKVVNKTPKKYRIFFKNISNQSNEFNYSKEVDSSPRSKNFIFKNNNNLIGKKISFENKILNKLSEQKEFNEIYYDKDLYNFIKPKYLEFKRHSDTSREKRNKDKKEFYKNFKHLKEKLKKQNEANDNIMNDIKKQQSLKKHNIQVGIVKLNEYKVKLRIIRKLNSSVF